MNQLSVVLADSQELEKQLRIASIPIALWDYIITLPAEWRFYRSQSSIWRLSPSCVLFILIRYVSVLVMVISNYGVLSTSFTEETCQHYYIVAPIFKVIQTMVSQGILGLRTFQKRNRRVGIALVALYFVTISLEWFTNMFHRIPVVVNGTCTPGNSGKARSAYFYYITTTLYDFSVLTISSVCLLQYDTLSKRLGRRLRSLVYDGIGYFIVLTGMNVCNIIFYHAANVQTQAEGASVGYAVTWIMSQRILISRLRQETSTAECQLLENVVFARPANPSHTVMSSCSQFDSKGHANVDIAPTLPRKAHDDDVELGIRVRVDRSMVVDDMNESEQR